MVPPHLLRPSQCQKHGLAWLQQECGGPLFLCVSPCRPQGLPTQAHLHVVLDCFLSTSRNLPLTAHLQVSTPPAFPHANNNLFQISFNNFLWRFSKISSAKQSEKGIGLAPSQHQAIEMENSHCPAVLETAPGSRHLWLRTEVMVTC